MNDLTQQEAERSARARGWTERAGIWFDGDSMRVPLSDIGKFFDPHFWFPLLWETLEGLSYFSLGGMNEMKNHQLTLDMGDDKVKYIYAESACLALCAAIEALEGKT